LPLLKKVFFIAPLCKASIQKQTFHFVVQGKQFQACASLHHLTTASTAQLHWRAWLGIKHAGHPKHGGLAFPEPLADEFDALDAGETFHQWQTQMPFGADAKAMENIGNVTYEGE
jgi:hypothetical protein